MNAKIVILLGGSALAAISCRKAAVVEPACLNHCTTVSGQFTTDNRTTPIANLSVQMEWIDSNSGFRTTVRKKAKATTDAQGRYNLTFYVQDDELNEGYFQIKYVADAKAYILDRDSKAEFWLKLKRDTALVSNWLLPRKAFVHPEITNPTQVVGSYWGQYNFANGNYPYQGKFTYGVVFNFNGGLPLADIEVAANQPVDLQTDKTKNGQRVITHDTILLAPGTTYVHRVTY